jgi:hypothetical protein
VSLLVLLVGLIIAAGLSWTSFELNQKNEDRLLRLEAKQAATVLDAVVPTIQTPLASAAYVATAGSNSGADFRGYIQSYLGAGQPFVSASLWRLSGRSAQLITVVGSSPMLAADPAAASSFLASATGGSGFGLTGPLGTVARSRLGYALPAQKGSEKYVVYAESALPAGRVALVTPGSPFSDLRFALYLGSSPRSDMLLEANSGQLPISGRTEAVRVRFGAGALLLVAAPARPIGGALATSLWWILAAAGGVLAVIAAATAEGLMRRRLAAERLTGEVRHLLGEQRTIAETLQHALLPETLPVMAGVQAAVRYLPGTNGVEIGGDWYDVMPLDDTRFFFVVGDVSGRGVPAGSVMASLRFAIRGFVSEGHPPETVLSALGGLLDLAEDHRFATVVCGVADVARRGPSTSPRRSVHRSGWRTVITIVAAGS